MLEVARRWSNCLWATLGRRSRSTPDPAARLDAIIAEAETHHHRLVERVRSSVTGQQRAEIRLNSKLAELERLHRNAHRALLMADGAGRVGDAATAHDYGHAAETITTELTGIEQAIETLSGLVIAAARATDEAKADLASSSEILRDQVARAVADLDQIQHADRRAQIDEVMRRLSVPVGDEVPTSAEIEERIRVRRAAATTVAMPGDRPTDPSEG